VKPKSPPQVNFASRSSGENYFVGGAQIDRYGNRNSTVIGDYAKPKTRLPGSGGAFDAVTFGPEALGVFHEIGISKIHSDIGARESGTTYAPKRLPDILCRFPLSHAG
jgi:hypothetical protein